MIDVLVSWNKNKFLNKITVSVYSNSSCCRAHSARIISVQEQQSTQNTNSQKNTIPVIVRKLYSAHYILLSDAKLTE